jgi:hypothetical protein
LVVGNAGLKGHVYSVMRRLALMPLMLAAVSTFATACTGSSRDGIASNVGPGKPLLATAPPVPGDGRDVELTVREDGVLDILTWGSGSCPYVPVEVERLSAVRVRIVMEERGQTGSGGCTDDLAPTVATLKFPDEVKYRDPVRVDLEGVGPSRSMSARLGFTTNSDEGRPVRTRR